MFNKSNLFSLIILVLIISTSSCKKDLEDDKQFAEETQIEKFLNSTIIKKFTKVNGAYHVIIDTSELAIIEKGRTVSFWYRAYSLSNIKVDSKTKAIVGVIFDTNIKADAITAGLDTNTHNFDPIKVKIGANKIIKGLDLGILQLRDEERALLLFPSTLGYGDDMMGPLKPWTSLVFDIEIINVE